MPGVITGMSTLGRKVQDSRVLSNLALGYTNADFIGNILFPIVQVPSRDGRIVTFDDSARERFDDRRAPGGRYNEIETGYGSDPYTLENHGLMYRVDEEDSEEAANVGINLGRMATMALMDATALNMEIERAQIALDPANYPNLNTAVGAADRFDIAGSRPAVMVKEFMTEVGKAGGRRPNIAIGSQEVTDALSLNQDVRDQFHQTSSAHVDEAMIARYLGIERYINAGATWIDPNTNTPEFIWGKNLILAHVPPTVARATHSPYSANTNLNARINGSKFYTYVLQGRNQLRVSNPFWDDFTDSWYYKMKYERGHYLTSLPSGFLMTDVVN